MYFFYSKDSNFIIVNDLIFLVDDMQSIKPRVIEMKLKLELKRNRELCSGRLIIILFCFRIRSSLDNGKKHYNSK